MGLDYVHSYDVSSNAWAVDGQRFGQAHCISVENSFNDCNYPHGYYVGNIGAEKEKELLELFMEVVHDLLVF